MRLDDVQGGQREENWLPDRWEYNPHMEHEEVDQMLVVAISGGSQMVS